jgi:hypothetical protein
MRKKYLDTKKDFSEIMKDIDNSELSTFINKNKPEFIQLLENPLCKPNWSSFSLDSDESKDFIDIS